ncbi:Coilin-like protein [Drosera capensis]
MTDPIRLRLLFDGGGGGEKNILSKAQRREGLKRSWMLLKPQQQHASISDVVSHIVDAFRLRDSCPNGILLSMDDFVLPPFESTAILKDKDLIWRRGGKGSTTTNDIGWETTPLEDYALEKPPVASGMMLLANEEFEKETGGYQSETEEESDMFLADSTQNMDPVSKKRKASNNFESSKKKKPRQIANGKVENSVQDKQGECHQLDGADKKRKSSTLDSKWVDEDAKTTSKPSEVPAETKKSSRSARRKKIKRLLWRKNRMTENVKLLEGCLTAEALKVNAVAEKDSVINKPSEPPKASLAMKDVAADSEVAKNINGNSLEHLPADPDSDADCEIAPIIVRPGHIRFTPYEKDNNVQQNRDPKGEFLWNGTTNKRKGQKWGTDRQPAPHRYQQKIFNGDHSSHRKMKEKKPVDPQADFEKLVPLVDPPKQGDVIAYRLLELSSSFSPELSSFRVGKIQSVDPESNRIMLIPVPEYPLQFEKKTDDDGCGDPGLPFETSQYKDDGSLEIDFNSLVNARMVKCGNLGPADASPRLPVANGQPSTCGVTSRGANETTVSDRIISASGTQPITDKWETHSRASGNGDGNPWEELVQAIDAKKADLQQNSKWNKKNNTEKQRSWSYGTSQRSALGPTLNRLREQNGI